MSTPRHISDEVIAIVREIYGPGPIPLHRPVFVGNERRYLDECIESNFVSSVGARVTEFEQSVARFVGCKHAVATVNGTAALHVALRLAGATAQDEVLTQAVTFIATCNALAYIGAKPVFLDIDLDTMGLSPRALQEWLNAHGERRPMGTFNRSTGRRIAACVPMHSFGHPARIEEIAAICTEWKIPLVEDAAESLGSWVDGRHTGTFGSMGTLSFNGNKVITTGGGGMIVTNDADLAARAKHLTTTAKVPHPYEFFHNEVGYNYRLPNLNAALGCAQMELLPAMLEIKAEVAARYATYFARCGVRFVTARAGMRCNYWLNAIIASDREERDAVLSGTNVDGVMTRPLWRLMNALPMFNEAQTDGLKHSHWLEDRLVNIPSSVPASAFERLKR